MINQQLQQQNYHQYQLLQQQQQQQLNFQYQKNLSIQNMQKNKIIPQNGMNRIQINSTSTTQPINRLPYSNVKIGVPPLPTQIPNQPKKPEEKKKLELLPFVSIIDMKNRLGEFILEIQIKDSEKCK
jgi:hypothetical protein